MPKPVRLKEKECIILTAFSKVLLWIDLQRYGMPITSPNNRKKT
jgi:hypothetical protein